MTVEEYKRKLESYSTSNAPIELKEKKIKELNDLFYGRDISNVAVIQAEIELEEQDND